MATVLIVEDDSVLAETMAAHLREAGHESVQTGDGRKALSRLRYQYVWFPFHPQPVIAQIAAW